MMTLTLLNNSPVLLNTEAVAAAEELRRLAGPLLVALESLGTAIVATDPRKPDNPIVFVNAAFTRLTGYLPSQVIGRNCRLLQGPDTDRHSVASLALTLQDRGQASARLLNYRKDGSPFWNNMSIAPVVDDGGQTLFFLATLVDITASCEPVPSQADLAPLHAVTQNPMSASTISEVAASWEWQIAAKRIVGDVGFARAYGLDPAAAAAGITPARFFSIVHPQDRDRIRLAVGGMLRGAEVFSKEYRLIVSTGVVRWVHARGRCHYDAAGNPTHFSVVLVDINEQKRLQEQLRIAQTAGGVGTFEYVTGFGTAAVSTQFCSLLGLYATADLPVRTINSLVVPGDEPIIDLAARPKPGDTSRVETRILRPDTNEIRWLMRRGEYLHDAEIAGIRFSGVIYDITEAKRTEAQLRSLTEALESRVEQRTRERDRIWRVSQDLLGVADMSGIWLSINPAWTKLLDWQEADILGKTSEWLETLEDQPLIREKFASLGAGERIVTFISRLRRRDGDMRWLSWTVVSEEGSLYCVARDVTAEKEAAEALRQTEEQLRQSQKMEAVGQLTGGIAHDFNNMLQGVTSGITLAERRIARGRPEDAQRFLEAARVAASRAGLLTQRLLAFGRRQALAPKLVLLDELVHGMESLLHQTIGPSVTIELQLQPDCWPVFCDPNQLENALLNLVINARDAMMPAGGRLLIDTLHMRLDENDTKNWEGAVPGEYVRIGVTDSGTGMTPEVIAHAFEPFFTTKPMGQGTGLGLSQIYGFVRQSRGVVQLSSEQGVGTSVYLYLARSHEKPVAEDNRRLPRGRQHVTSAEVATVLLVEDEAAIRIFVSEALRELGYRVIEAVDGPTGLHTLLEILHSAESTGVDLMVTDIGLPGGLNGRQLADAARLVAPSLPILLITGYVGDAMKDEDRLGPGMELLVKPFELDVLAERVQTMISRARIINEPAVDPEPIC
jgi:PAS domain S-box-containing protein